MRFIHPAGPARQTRRARSEHEQAYCEAPPVADCLGHIESNVCPVCDGAGAAGAVDGAAAAGAGAVGGGAGQMPWDCCVVCCGAGGAGHATPCCDAAPIGGGAGQLVCESLLSGSAFGTDVDPCWGRFRWLWHSVRPPDRDFGSWLGFDLGFVFGRLLRHLVRWRIYRVGIGIGLISRRLVALDQIRRHTGRRAGNPAWKKRDALALKFGLGVEHVVIENCRRIELAARRAAGQHQCQDKRSGGAKQRQLVPVRHPLSPYRPPR